VSCDDVNANRARGILLANKDECTRVSRTFSCRWLTLWPSLLGAGAGRGSHIQASSGLRPARLPSRREATSTDRGRQQCRTCSLTANDTRAPARAHGQDLILQLLLPGSCEGAADGARTGQGTPVTGSQRWPTHGSGSRMTADASHSSAPDTSTPDA